MSEKNVQVEEGKTSCYCCSLSILKRQVRKRGSVSGKTVKIWFVFPTTASNSPLYPTNKRRNK
jgi:hypothetical protein